MRLGLTRHLRVSLSGFIVVAALVSGGCEGEARATSAEERGKQIFTKGASPSGDDLTVSLGLFGSKESSFPARRYACSNCHGPEGLSTVEGGVTVPSIQAELLATPVRVANGTGRLRDAYDERTLRRAITMGVDSSGNRLNTLMPRYNISDRDLDDLLTYVTALGTEPTPGVTEAEIRIATVLHEDPSAKEVTAVILQTLQAFVQEANQRGGIYGRKLELEALTVGQWVERGSRPDGVSDLLCVVAPYGPLVGGASEIPILGVLQPEPLTDPAAQPGVFHLYPSQLSQLRVAIDHYCDVLKNEAPRFALVVSRDEDRRSFHRALEGQVGMYEGASIVSTSDLTSSSIDDADVLLLLGPPDHKERVLRGVGGAAHWKAIYTTHEVPSTLFQNPPPGLLDRLRFLLPIPVPSETDPRVAEFRAFLAKHELPENLVSLRVATLASASVFAEALKRCGQSVTRDRLLREVRSLYKYRPGLFPPVSYDQNRTIGARGAQVAQFDPDTRSLKPMSDWSEPR